MFRSKKKDLGPDFAAALTTDDLRECKKLVSTNNALATEMIMSVSPPAYPLYWAAFHGASKCIEWMLTLKSVDPNFRTPQDRMAPIIIAAVRGHIEVIQVLLADSRVDINAQSEDGATALYAACQEGHATVVLALIRDDRISVSARFSTGATPLITAASQGHELVVKYLLKHPRINPNAVNAWGHTALHQAAASGHKEVIKVLLSDPRVDLDVRTNESEGAKTAEALARFRRDIAPLFRQVRQRRQRDRMLRDKERKRQAMSHGGKVPDEAARRLGDEVEKPPPAPPGASRRGVDREEIEMWSVQQVFHWLLDTVPEIAPFKAKFVEFEIDGESLLGLDDDLLREHFEIDLAPVRSKIIQAINLLQLKDEDEDKFLEPVFDGTEDFYRVAIGLQETQDEAMKRARIPLKNAVLYKMSKAWTVANPKLKAEFQLFASVLKDQGREPDETVSRQLFWAASSPDALDEAIEHGLHTQEDESSRSVVLFERLDDCVRDALGRDLGLPDEPRAGLIPGASEQDPLFSDTSAARAAAQQPVGPLRVKVMLVRAITGRVKSVDNALSHEDVVAEDRVEYDGIRFDDTRQFLLFKSKRGQCYPETLVEVMRKRGLRPPSDTLAPVALVEDVDPDVARLQERLEHEYKIRPPVPKRRNTDSEDEDVAGAVQHEMPRGAAGAAGAPAALISVNASSRSDPRKSAKGGGLFPRGTQSKAKPTRATGLASVVQHQAQQSTASIERLIPKQNANPRLHKNRNATITIQDDEDPEQIIAKAKAKRLAMAPLAEENDAPPPTQRRDTLEHPDLEI